MRAALLAVLLAVSSAPAFADGSWIATGKTGDWTGRDYGCSKGPLPQNFNCTPEHNGQVAVCWSDRRTGECENARSWCTYKTVTEDTPYDGANPGAIYRCSVKIAYICKKSDALECKVSKEPCSGKFPITVDSLSENKKQACRKITDGTRPDIAEECSDAPPRGCAD